MSESTDYYVYVYIDPRNCEEFYIGKGTGSRKNAHRPDEAGPKTNRRIAAIHKAGSKPIIRIIAKDLSANEAFLVEKTLLWKLGSRLTNVSAGHYSKNFRPQDTLHRDIPGFDFRCGIYFYNIGEGVHRCWDDYVEFDIISAGHGPSWRKAMLGFHEGDIFAAYASLKAPHGFVGIGQVTSPAKPIREVMVKGKPLLSYKLHEPKMADDADSNDLCEYVAAVKWIKVFDRSEAKRKSKKEGMFTSRLVRASLDNQQTTIAFLEKEFGVNLRKLCAET
jgi:hypothetical protein